ncbi:MULTISPECIES: sigma 54 modulation/S30EA ribosomal C-terminal domain-containing protein [Streptomyces]|uniref:Sigma 54 modulation/S30EA ribosomal C-terminal domain-containing protein n=1 Tax=Streptomyces actuosus TaxID=1885 RepID=A0ABS2VNV7_STRAS|nr:MULTISPECIES: sigma 54 modulation/S30EA ribosomal C-terminal domain-containing protein [Streptomyces]MBN0044736.1 sigma 54 modulation/S30EA ribosomal C-terminal domain-containing protein [Streptomyces actuosus]MCH0565197.1 sigma 54 modulation/S30EA ribosomal C-terminal domain-containing protein [Streptomyces sp. MUM 2J]MCH0568280.1 sigma 54 modulation/S30EA ribosomal C-terminal domain-containing protein [Streptomyces sp. MUM 136J]
MNRLKSRPDVDVQVETRGQVPRNAARYAQDKTLTVIEHVGEPVLAAQVKLSLAANPAAARPAHAQAVVNLNGRPVRAHVAADSLFEAVDLLRDRLAARLARARGHRQDRHHGTAESRSRTAGDGAGQHHRPVRHHVVPEDRRIVRRKSFGLPRQPVHDAVVDLDLLDYDFYLFTDAVSGQDSIVYRDEDGHHRMASASGQDGRLVEPEGAGTGPGTVPVPEIGVTDAVARLELAGLPFVFFTDRTTGRGSVVYHRFDGHYGLIVPAA